MRKAVVPTHRAALPTRDRKLARITLKLHMMVPPLRTLQPTPTPATQHVIIQVTSHPVLPGARSKVEELLTETE